MIKAPYNFVPLTDNAFYPGWANHISQDFPFEDGVSGCIGYTMKAETPIFVRNGYTDRQHPAPRFSHTEERRYFIPGTSIKGEIRNVLEILSFGKMTQVQDARFGIRDLNDNRYRDQLRGTHCGWLYCTQDEAGESYKVIDCGELYMISPEDIDHAFGTKLEDFKRTFTCDRNNADKDKEELLRSAYKKYIDVLRLSLAKNVDCKNLIESKFHIRFSSKQDKYGRNIATINSNGSLSGTIIVTGQPDKRQEKTDPKTGEMKWIGKYYEFVFPDSDEELPVERQIADDFLAIHKNNYDFKNLWQDNLHNGYKIPVFFTLKGNKVDAIGLSGMFRIPSANFIKGAIPVELQSACRKDLAECIFGSAKKELGYLKGRVTFSPAFATNGGTEMKEVETTLSSPKPSYGPLYVEGGTWNDSNARIKGRKRYPVKDIIDRNDKTGNGNTETKFIPLDKGVEFSGKIYFHNLRKCELGALVSALTFNGRQKCFHSIGEAKPLGYGKVKTTICSATLRENTKDAQDSYPEVTDLQTFIKTYLHEFESMMTAANVGWSAGCASISELQAMARGISDNQCDEFKYMKMDTKNREQNEFYQSQKDKENLPSFSDILKGDVKTISDGDRSRTYKNDIDNEIIELDSIYNKIDKAKQFLSKNDYAVALNEIKLLKEKGTPIRFTSQLDEIEKEAKRIEEEYKKNQVSDMKTEIKVLMDKADASNNNEIKLKFLNDAISKCNEALQISSNDAEIREWKTKCEHIIAGMRTIEQVFEAYTLNSIAAFAGRIHNWMRDSDTATLNKEQLDFLGHLIQNGMVGLNNQNRRAWQDRKKWEKAFQGTLPTADVDAIFAIATNE